VIVAVETNFILQLALQQEQAEQAERILKLAEDKKIEIAIPACAFPEAYTKLVGLSKLRNKLLDDLRRELKQMARSKVHASLEQTSKDITDALATTGTQFADDLDKIANRLRACATIIPLTSEVTKVMSYLELLFDLEPGDAFIYASVESYLDTRKDEQKVFVTTDKDFEVTRVFLSGKGIDLAIGIGTGYGAITEKLNAKA
jgi:PIN domain.